MNIVKFYIAIITLIFICFFGELCGKKWIIILVIIRTLFRLYEILIAFFHDVIDNQDKKSKISV